MKDLKERLGRIIVAYNFAGEPVTAKDLNAVGSMAALLKDAIKPNLVQTLEHTGALVHGGPFANIAHGCNSVMATRTALKLADVAITEAGFGADLGAEKFFDIKCRKAGIQSGCSCSRGDCPRVKVQRRCSEGPALRGEPGGIKEGYRKPGEAHRESSRNTDVPVVVTLNSFLTDTEAEYEFIRNFCEERGCEFALSEVWAKGGDGGIELAEKVLNTLETKTSDFASVISG